MIRTLFCALMLLVPNTGLADAVLFRYGLGFGAAGQIGRGEIKWFSVGYERDHAPGIVGLAELGVVADMKESMGRRSGAFASYSVGTKMQLGTAQTRYAWGVGYLSHTDQMLSSHFQFTHDLTIGLYDHRTGLSLGYKHISNAGITLPNRGRDFITLRSELYF